MYVTELRSGQTIKIGDSSITIIRSNNSRIKLAIDADKSLKIEIERKESPLTKKQDA